MQKLKKYQNGIFLVVMLSILATSYFVTQDRLTQQSQTVDLPVIRVEQGSDNILATAAGAGTALEAYQKERETVRAADMQALKLLTENTNLTQDVVSDAAAQLQEIIRCRESEIALEGALLAGGFSPCLAVVQKGAVTVLTQQKDLTQTQASMILTLAVSHTGEEKKNIKIITGDML